MVFFQLMQKGIAAPIVRFHLSLFLIVVIGLHPVLAADDKPNIMLINSDASIEKYRTAADEFKKAIEYPVDLVHLNEKKWDISSVESFMKQKQPDLIYCVGTKAYLIAHKYAGDTPLVFSSIINWLRLPTKNKVYGISNELNASMQLTIVRYLFPDIRRIGVLYSQEYHDEWFKNTCEEAKQIGVDIIGKQVSAVHQTDSALKSLLPKVDLFWLISDPVIMSDKETFFMVLTICDQMKKPVVAYNESFAEYGAALVISVDDSTIGRQAAEIAGRVIRKETITDKVLFSAGTRIVINLKKIKEYGVNYSKDALGSANEIIE